MSDKLTYESLFIQATIRLQYGYNTATNMATNSATNSATIWLLIDT